MSKVYAKGTKALAVCDRSGFAFPYREMVKEPGTGFIVHWTESDGGYSIVNHPQNFPPKDLGDAIALRWARPERNEDNFNEIFLADNDGNVIEFQDLDVVTIYVPASKGGYA